MSIGTFYENSTWRDVLNFARTEDPEWNYIITGRGGPTGKTFLYNKLKKNGYNAIEISEDLAGLVDYRDNKNHYFVDRAKKQLVIVLNKPIYRTGSTPWNGRSEVGPAWDGFRAGAAEAEREIHVNVPEDPVEAPLIPLTHSDIVRYANDIIDNYIESIKEEAKIRSMFKELDIIPLSQQKLKPQIKDVIFNDPATIVFWSDGTKTVVKTQDNEMGDHEIYDPEKGLAMAIAKKALGNKREYYHTFLHWLKKNPIKSYLCMYCGTETTNPAWDHACDECSEDFNKKYDPVQAAYDILVKFQNDSEVPNKKLDDALRYIHDALED